MALFSSLRNLFPLIYDQKSVSYMFNNQHKRKVTNKKIARWHLVLMPYSYKVVHPPGFLSATGNALSRKFCALLAHNDLGELHKTLCHQGCTRLTHFVQVKNMSYSVEYIKRDVSGCQTCQQLKTHYYRPKNKNLFEPFVPLIESASVLQSSRTSKVTYRSLLATNIY